MTNRTYLTALLILLYGAATAQSGPGSNYTRYVNPFIGTLGEGNVFAGACLPHSFVKLGADTRFSSGASGYKRGKEIKGFSHLHITGMGGPMYGNIQLMPATGAIDPAGHYSAAAEEVGHPGYYKVVLPTYNVTAELTTTAHAGFHRYTFPESNTSHVLIDVGATLYGFGPTWSSSVPISGELHIDAANKAVYGSGTYRGGRSTKKPWTVFFYAVFDTKFDSYGAWKDSVTTTDAATEMKGAGIGAYLNFQTAKGQQVKVKVGISMISTEQAMQNVQQEIKDWDFDRTKAAADAAWEAELRKIDVQGISENDKTIFYTALYHALLDPSDWTAENPAFNYHRPYYENYLCVWDIFRTVSPLLALISTKQHIDMLNTLLDDYQYEGWLPDGHSALQREHIQVGTNADVLLADAYVKGLKGVDYKLAYEAIKKNAEDTTNQSPEYYECGRRGLPSYKQYHYVAADAKFEGRRLTVSRTLEYVYDDFCLYQMAKGMHQPADATRYRERSFWYKNHWDGGLKLMRGRNMDGSWLTPFDPLKTESGPSFYEGHSYTWTYTVPHDVKGLINLLDGRQAFIDNLTHAVSDHYQAFNEPCMLQIYLFVWAGRPDLTQEFVRKESAKNFTNADNGLPGNDDSGTTSAWYLWSRMGIFPVAGQDLYIIGSPSARQTTLRMESGKNIVINAANASEENIYIQSAKLNGKPYNKAFFTQADIRNGATFDFVMGTKPSTWGSTIAPPSLSDNL